MTNTKKGGLETAKSILKKTAVYGLVGLVGSSVLINSTFGYNINNNYGVSKTPISDKMKDNRYYTQSKTIWIKVNKMLTKIVNQKRGNKLSVLKKFKTIAQKEMVKFKQKKRYSHVEKYKILCAFVQDEIDEMEGKHKKEVVVNNNNNNNNNIAQGNYNLEQKKDEYKEKTQSAREAFLNGSSNNNNNNNNNNGSSTVGNATTFDVESQNYIKTLEESVRPEYKKAVISIYESNVLHYESKLGNKKKAQKLVFETMMEIKQKVVSGTKNLSNFEKLKALKDGRANLPKIQHGGETNLKDGRGLAIPTYKDRVGICGGQTELYLLAALFSKADYNFQLQLGQGARGTNHIVLVIDGQESEALDGNVYRTTLKTRYGAPIDLK